MRPAQRAARLSNPAARAEYIDALTGQRVPASTPGAVATGRKVMRIRPRADEPFELVAVEPDDLDPALDRFGVEPEATPRYRRIAQQQAQRGRPFERDTDLHGAGISTTFASGKAAAKIFMEGNPEFFDAPSFDDVDAHDTTLDFMDRLEVRSGKRYVKLAKTHRGQQILSGGPTGSGTAIARDMLAYLFGQAGRSRRWRDVPWGHVYDYVAMLRHAMELEARRRQIAMPSSAPLWVPLASGQYAPDEMLVLATEQLGASAAERLADWLNSQELYELADRLTAVLSPPKGPGGRAGRRARRCLGKEARKAVAARRRQIEHWAAYPREIPQWTCVSTQATEASSAGLCLFPGLAEEVSRVERACDRPYDPSWPDEVRNRRCAEGDEEQFGSGIAPLGCDGVAPSDALELPWESNPGMKPIKQQTIAAVARRHHLAQTQYGGAIKTHRYTGVRIIKHGRYVAVLGMPEEVAELASAVLREGAGRVWHVRTQEELTGTVTPEQVPEGSIIITGPDRETNPRTRSSALSRRIRI